MNILITNFHSCCNAGDRAILAVTLRQIAQSYPQATVTVAVNDIATYQTLRHERTVPSFYAWAIRPDAQNHAQLVRWVTPIYAVLLVLIACVYRLTRIRVYGWADSTRRKTLQAYFDADLVMACGGGYLFASATAGSWFLILWLIAAFGAMLGKKTVLLPQSIGPLEAPWQRRVVGWLVQRSALTLVREQTSRQLLQAMGVEKNVQVHPDIAFDFNPTIHLTDKTSDCFSGASFHVGMTLLNWVAQGNRSFEQNSYERAALRLIEHVGSLGGRVHLFAQVRGPFFADDDRVVAQRILEQSNPQHVIWHSDIVDSESLFAAYGHMDFFVATRLHSAIFAMNQSVPTLVVGYLHKSVGVLQELNLEHWCVPIEQTNAQNIIERFEELHRQKAALQSQLRNQIPVAQTQAAQTVAQIRAHLETERGAHP